jgi:hypothetical protein
MKKKEKKKKPHRRNSKKLVKAPEKKITRVKKAREKKKERTVKIAKNKPLKKRVGKKLSAKNRRRKRIKIKEGLTGRGPVYVLNPDFEFFNELRDLVLKSSPAEKDRMIARLNKLGRIKLAIVSGVFINKENLDPLISDLLLVGDDIDRRKLRAFLKATEAEVGKEIKFTLMDKEEFQYRMAMFDRFVRVLLEGPHEKLINRLGV